MAIGAFGNKVFEVNPNKIITPNGISVSESLDVEMQATEGGKPATYIKGVKEKSISFEIQLKYPYCDVLAEYEWWNNKMLSEVAEYLTLGNKTYGKMLLQSVSMADLKIAANGLYIGAKLSLAFSEYTRKGYKKKS